MAAETSEPRSGLVIQIGVGVIVLLISARFALYSYFNTQMGDEYTLKIGSHRNEQLLQLREDTQKALMTAPMPIEKAMAMVAALPRASLGAGMMPKPSDDMAAMVGWGQNPKPMPVMTSSATPGQDDGGAAATDGGSPGGDASSSTPTADGGAHTAPLFPDAGPMRQGTP